MRGQLRILVCILITMVPSEAILAKEVVGWVENIRIYPGDIMLRAKVDTGAKTSSLGCECKNTFLRDGKRWLALTIKNQHGQSIKLEKPIVRIVRIRRHFGKLQRRYVIRLGICLGTIYRESEVSVVDRSGFNYSFLIGRNFLQSDFLIDPSRTYLNKPDCKKGRQ